MFTKRKREHTHTKKIYQASFVPRKHRSSAGYGSYPASYVSGWRRSGHHLSIGRKGSSSVLTSLRRGAALMEPCTGGCPQGCVSTDWHDILLQPKPFCDSMITWASTTSTLPLSFCCTLLCTRINVSSFWFLFSHQLISVAFFLSHLEFPQ